jgi:hypothetical protein
MIDFFLYGIWRRRKVEREEDFRMLIAVCTAKHDVHIGHLSERVFAGYVQHMMMTGQAEQC